MKELWDDIGGWYIILVTLCLIIFMFEWLEKAYPEQICEQTMGKDK